MPKMQHAGRKCPILAAHAGMQESDQQIGILQTPAAEYAVESIDAIEVAAPDRQIAGARALPIPAAQLAQWAERQPQRREQPVDFAALPPRHQIAQRPGLRRDFVL